MTTLEAVPLEEVLRTSSMASRSSRAACRLEDLSAQQIARVMVAIQRMRRDKIEEIKDLAVARSPRP